MRKVLVFIEQREGEVRKASLGAWNLAAEALAPFGAAPCGLLVGPADTAALEGKLSPGGPLLHAARERFRLYDPEHYLRVLQEAALRQGADTVLMADTALSRDLAPRLAVRLGASLLQGCQECLPELPGCRRPVLAGAGKASFTALRPSIVCTVARSAQPVLPAAVQVEPWEPEASLFDGLASLARGLALRAGKGDVSEASVVVAGGRGVGGAEGFALLEELAGLLEGVVGASRSAVDEGWRPHGDQIGQTGKRIAPALYIACGISGAVQHLAGIDPAVTLVAINSDPHAPIFAAADYGLVADLHAALPALSAAVREFLPGK